MENDPVATARGSDTTLVNERGDAERLFFSHAKIIVAQRLSSLLLIYAIEG
jgi:hypothetical protein